MNDEEEVTEFHPNWVSPPGDTVKDILQETKTTQRELAAAMNISPSKLSRLLSGAIGLTPTIAVKLSAFIGGSPDFWIRRETAYRESLKEND